MRYFFPAVGAVLVLFLLFVIQNVLLITTTSLDYIYQSFSALELYASLCLLYFSLRFLFAKKKLSVNHTFPAVFSSSLFYCTAVIVGVDFNILNIAVSLVCLGLLSAGILCILFTFMAQSIEESDFPTTHYNIGLFSERECDVIKTVTQGKTIRETADELCISVSTVKTHLQHIYEKSGVRNRAELIRFIQNHPN